MQKQPGLLGYGMYWVMGHVQLPRRACVGSLVRFVLMLLAGVSSRMVDRSCVLCVDSFLRSDVVGRGPGSRVRSPLLNMVDRCLACCARPF